VGNWINGQVVGVDWNKVRTTPGLAYGTHTGSRDYDDSTHGGGCVNGCRTCGDLAAQAGDVGLREQMGEQFLDEGQEIVERPDWPEGRVVGSC